VIEIGSIVTLKSGGPRMAVEDIVVGQANSTVSVVWFEDGKGPFRDAFAMGLLQEVEQTTAKITKTSPITPERGDAN
jgi:uncharacterized protein YodC (DUF2158 family)